MTHLALAEVISALYVAISMIGLFTIHDRLKSTRILAICATLNIFWVLFDAASYMIYGMSFSPIFILMVEFFAYELGGISLAVFVYYSQLYYQEQTELKSIYFRIPLLLEILRSIVVAISFFNHKIVTIQNGVAVQVGGIPTVCIVIDLLVLIYIPFIAFLKRKIVGSNVFFLFSTYAALIISGGVIALVTGVDVTTVAGSFSVITIIALLQRRMSITELQSKNREQEIQIEQITSLNHELESRMDIIQSMSKVYYSSYYIDIDNNTFIELNSKKGIRDVVGLTGNAQMTMNNMCQKIIMPKYREEISEFTNLSTLNERLKDKSFVTFEYEGTISGWSQAYFIPGPRDESGHFSHAIYATRTIHDEKERENRSNAIIEGLSQEYHTVYLLDMDTHMLNLVRSSGVSTIQEAIKFGQEHPDFDTSMSMYIDHFVEPEDRERLKKEIKFEEIIRQLEGNNIYSVNYLRRDEYGHVGYHQISFANADTESGSRQIVYGFRDIDKIVKEEQSIKQELRDAKKAAEAANEAKTAFLNNMSHDIRTPMNAILGFAELIEKEKDNPEKVEDYLNKIKAAGKYLLTIINNVLDLARIESGSMEIDEECVDISDENNSAVPIFTTLFAEKNIHFTASQDVQHTHILLDQTKTQQITVNLLSNALKYTPEGGTVSVEMKEVPCEKEGYGTYIMTISDSGIGMSPEFVEHVFDAFTREKNTTESKIAGTGLGMAIVKRLVTLMGGTIEVESEIGKGTTFIVSVDHKFVSSPEEFAKSTTAKEADIRKIAGKRILLAEDNELNAEIATLVLRDVGLLVDLSRDGVECIKMLTEADPGYYDAILMDIQMPNLNGYDTAERIRKMQDQKKANIPIIAMTANVFEEDKRIALKSGMNAHLAKPINMDELILTLGETIK